MKTVFSTAACLQTASLMIDKLVGIDNIRLRVNVFSLHGHNKAKPARKKKYSHYLQSQWLTQYPWSLYDGDTMLCIL